MCACWREEVGVWSDGAKPTPVAPWLAKHGGIQMPAKSKSQQMAAGAALAAKRGSKKATELKGVSKSMYESMSERELHDMASTKQKGKPEHVSKS